MIRGLLAASLLISIHGRVPPMDTNEQRSCKEPFNHELGAQGGGGGGGIWEKIDGGFGRDNRDEFLRKTVRSSGLMIHKLTRSQLRKRFYNGRFTVF